MYQLQVGQTLGAFNSRGHIFGKAVVIGVTKTTVKLDTGVTLTLPKYFHKGRDLDVRGRHGFGDYYKIMSEEEIESEMNERKLEISRIEKIKHVERTFSKAIRNLDHADLQSVCEILKRGGA